MKRSLSEDKDEIIRAIEDDIFDGETIDDADVECLKKKLTVADLFLLQKLMNRAWLFGKKKSEDK